MINITFISSHHSIVFLLKMISIINYDNNNNNEPIVYRNRTRFSDGGRDRIQNIEASNLFSSINLKTLLYII